MHRATNHDFVGYTDYAKTDLLRMQDIVTVPPAQRQGPRGGVTLPFPKCLFMALFEAEKNGLDSIISWHPHGRSFTISDRAAFAKVLMPNFFRHTKLPSFLRQLNLYGFSQLKKGPARGGFYHMLFLRHRPDLCNFLFRKAHAIAAPSVEPNLYNFPPCPQEPSVQAIQAAETIPIHRDLGIRQELKATWQSQCSSSSSGSQESKRDVVHMNSVVSTAGNIRTSGETVLVKKPSSSLVAGLSDVSQQPRDNGSMEGQISSPLTTVRRTFWETDIKGGNSLAVNDSPSSQGDFPTVQGKQVSLTAATIDDDQRFKHLEHSFSADRRKRQPAASSCVGGTLPARSTRNASWQPSLYGSLKKSPSHVESQRISAGAFDKLVVDASSPPFDVNTTACSRTCPGLSESLFELLEPTPLTDEELEACRMVRESNQGHNLMPFSASAPADGKALQQLADYNDTKKKTHAATS